MFTNHILYLCQSDCLWFAGMVVLKRVRIRLKVCLTRLTSGFYMKLYMENIANIPYVVPPTKISCKNNVHTPVHGKISEC